MPRTITAEGRTITVPDDATDEEINQIFGPAPKELPKQEGFLHSLGSNLGLTDAPDPIANIKAHPIESAIDAIPGGQIARGLFEGAKRSGGELLDAGSDAIHGNPAGALTHGIKAIPILGSGIDKAADQYADKDTGGEMGTLTGTALQLAPALLGGIDAAAPNRGLLGQIPSTERAGAMFNDLNTKLADHPVSLNKTLEPLQRATELGARGGTLPKAVSDLLTRSQSPIDMTFPEIRDYQSNLSDLSRDAKGSLNGKMLGQIGKLKSGLFGDISDALEPVGRSADYAKAMNEFKRASQLKDLRQNAGKYAGHAILGGLGAGGLYEAYKALK